MHTLLVVALIVTAGGWALSWLVGRFSSRRGSELALVAGLAARIGVVAAMVYSTAQALDRGGWFDALAVLFVVIGAGAAVMTAIVAGALWLSLTGRVSD